MFTRKTVPAAAAIAVGALLAVPAATASATTPSAPPTAPASQTGPHHAIKPPTPGATTLGQAAGHRSAKSASSAASAVITVNSLYKVTPGQCLDADITGGGQNGTKVQVWACNGSTQQQWVSWDDYSMESVKYPGMCLDADLNGNGSNGTKIQLWACNGSTQQQWEVFANDLAFYNVRFYNNGNTVMDRDITVPGNGARAQLWAKNFQSQQWWSPNLA